MVGQLLEEGADVSARDWSFRTAKQVAFWNGSAIVFEAWKEELRRRQKEEAHDRPVDDKQDDIDETEGKKGLHMDRAESVVTLARVFYFSPQPCCGGEYNHHTFSSKFFAIKETPPKKGARSQRRKKHAIETMFNRHIIASYDSSFGHNSSFSFFS